MFILRYIQQNLRRAYSSNLNLYVRKYVYKSTELCSIATAFSIFESVAKILKKTLPNKNTFNILRCDIRSATEKLYLSKLVSGPTKMQNRK